MCATDSMDTQFQMLCAGTEREREREGLYLFDPILYNLQYY